jgi:UDP-N-acetylmuramoylalanine--D-glutamate ligase
MKVVVVGGGKTGISVAKFYRKMGHKVIINDIKREEEFTPEELKNIKAVAEFAGGGHSRELLNSADRIVVSPGVPPGLIKNLVEDEEKLKGDIEDAYEWVGGNVIGVTGTKGKTSFSLLISKVLEEEGYKVFTGGNIGTPYIDAYGKNCDYIVLELSSFQLEWVERFHPKIAILLNLKPDHLDRYKDMKEYFSAKVKIFKNQEKGDIAILSAEIPFINTLHLKSDCFFFSTEREVERGAYKISEKVKVNVKKEKEFIFDRDILLRVLSWENLLAYLVFSEAFGIKEETYIKVLKSFTPPPHRLQKIGEWEGIEFFNDSKSTTPASVMNALKILDAPIILIMGGRNKNLSFYELREEIGKKAKAVLLFGESKEEIKGEIKNCGAEIFVTNTLEEAVQLAIKIGQKGDRVLFSPGCASFDMFRNYEERGEKFIEAVRRFTG